MIFWDWKSICNKVKIFFKMYRIPRRRSPAHRWMKGVFIKIPVIRLNRKMCPFVSVIQLEIAKFYIDGWYLSSMEKLCTRLCTSAKITSNVLNKINRARPSCICTLNSISWWSLDIHYDAGKVLWYYPRDFMVFSTKVEARRKFQIHQVVYF